MKATELRSALSALPRWDYQRQEERRRERLQRASQYPIYGRLGRYARRLMVENLLQAGWTGLVVEWIRRYTAEWREMGARRLLEFEARREWPLVNLVSNAVVLDVSDGSVAPAMGLAILNPNTPLVQVVEDAARAKWLEAMAQELGIDNVFFVEGLPEELQFEEVIYRDERAARVILKRYRRFSAPFGRRYLVRESEPQRSREGAFVQSIPLRPYCHVMQFQGVPLEEGVEELQRTGRELLKRIEGELEEVARQNEGFARWLREVFLPMGRTAIEEDEFAERSELAIRGVRELPEGGPILDWLRAFDLLMERRKAPKQLMQGKQAVSEGGRLLTKAEWGDIGWLCVDASPYEPDYFPKAMAALAWGMGMKVNDRDPWDFVMEGKRVMARMNYRGSCSIAAETDAVRDKIFLGLQRTRC